MTARIIADRYQIVRQLGAGGMGAVYLARQIGVGNQVALKFLPAQFSAEPSLRKRFEREAAMSLEVTHPGAAQLLDTGEHEGQLFLAFEYVEGDDLSTVLDQQGALPFLEAADIAMKVASVLAFAHSRGVVHRDIKPENIRLRRDVAGWHVKVLDFGIARLMDGESTQLTAEGAVAGTPRYMAPEQINNGMVDACTDIYALGLVLFEMVSGREAFVRESTPQLLWAHMHDPVPPLREVQPDRDHTPLDDVIAKASAKQPADRYANALEFVGALKALDPPRWPAPQPVKRRRTTSASGSSDNGESAPRATPLFPPSNTRRNAKRSNWLALGLGGAAVALAGAALWVTLARPSASGNLAGGVTASAACPGIDQFDPSFTGLSVPQLEQRARDVRYMMPSLAAQQLERLQATVQSYAPAARECHYRMLLISSLASERTLMQTTPSFWGHNHTPAELTTMFMQQPLKQNWSAAARRDVLAQVESLYIANLSKDTPADGEFWRRQYFGVLLICEATDAALATLKAKRPGGGDCLQVRPRVS